MHGILRRFAAALLLVGTAALAAESSGSHDPAFASIPFDRWIDEGDQAHIRWTAKLLPVQLSNHQRLLAKVELTVDGNELARRRGKGYLAMLVQFSDSESRVYQTHEALDLQQVKEDAGKSNYAYTQSAFVTPGDYRIALAVFDTATGEHSAMQLSLHVNPLKNDIMPEAWRDLPPVEILKAADSPDDLFLPSVTGRLRLSLETRRPVRVELLVNASPLSAGDQPSRNEQVNNLSLTSLIPALKIFAQANVPNGALNVALLDLTKQRVIFHQDSVHDLDWAKLAPALKQTGSNVIDVHALENRRENAQFFLAEVRRRIGASSRSQEQAQPFPILIVLSGPMEFGSGEDLRPIELGAKPETEVFYIRYHSIPPQPLANPFAEELRRSRRMSIPASGRTPPAFTEPIDSLERTLKPLQPHLYDVYTPEQFRKTLSVMLEEISKL